MSNKIEIIDDILAPSEMMVTKFRGKNPFSICTMIPGMLKDVMKISGVDLRENDIRWDITDDPRTFYGMWQGKRGEDRWTTTFIRIIIQGAQSTTDKTGWAEVRYKGFVRTRYDYVNFIQKSFWWFFNYMFYYKQRRNYIDYSKDNVYKMKEILETKLGIAAKKT